MNLEELHGPHEVDVERDVVMRTRDGSDFTLTSAVRARRTLCRPWFGARRTGST
jgi:hypothetical protein